MSPAGDTISAHEVKTEVMLLVRERSNASLSLDPEREIYDQRSSPASELVTHTLRQRHLEQQRIIVSTATR